MAKQKLTVTIRFSEFHGLWETIVLNEVRGLRGSGYQEMGGRDLGELVNRIKNIVQSGTEIIIKT